MRMYKHLEEMNEDYKTHMFHALRMSGKMFMGGCKGLIHAFIPDFYETGVSDTCREVLEIKEKRD